MFKQVIGIEIVNVAAATVTLDFSTSGTLTRLILSISAYGIQEQINVFATYNQFGSTIPYCYLFHNRFPCTTSRNKLFLLNF